MQGEQVEKQFDGMTLEFIGVLVGSSFLSVNRDFLTLLQLLGSISKQLFRLTLNNNNNKEIIKQKF